MIRYYKPTDIIDFEEFWSSNVLAAALNDPDSVCLVYEVDGKVAGYGVLKNLEIDNICVDPKFRRKGYGQQILEALIAEVKGAEIILEVAIDNIAARELYGKYGFEELYVRKKYYDGKTDAVVMVKKLEPLG